jgi:S1-C subfamily serine protease
MMNSQVAEETSVHFAERLRDGCNGDLDAAVTLGFRSALGRPPTPVERAKGLDYIQGDLARLKGFAWLLLNLDEFLFVR